MLALVLNFYVSCFVLKHLHHLQSLVQLKVKPTNRDSITHVFPRFTPITCLLWDLIGSLDRLYLLWLITLCWILTFNSKFFFVVFLTRVSCCIFTIFKYLRNLYGETTNFGFAELTFLSLGQYRKTEDRTFEVDT